MSAAAAAASSATSDPPASHNEVGPSNASTGDRERRPSLSERALDATAFFLADVADGLGPFLVIFLTSQQGWSSGEAGTAMSLMLAGTVISQTFVGAWIDRTHHKRRAIAAAATIVGLACLSMYAFPFTGVIYALQFLMGVAVTVFPPAIASISLGLVGRERLAARAGRNEACFHAGNVAAAALAAGAGWMFGSAGIFIGAAVMAFASAAAVLCIREADVDHDLARGADCQLREPGVAGSGEDRCVAPVGSLLRDRRLLAFIAAAVLFHFANAAMLPLVGQKLAASQPEEWASALMAGCIITAQITMVPVALLASRYAPYGRRAVFLIAFAVLPLRGFLYTLTTDATALLAIQTLDGIAAGIYGVVALLMTADLTRGTGRFNLVQGMAATAVGVGAALSNLLTGLVVDAAGFDAGFFFLSTV
ncbi:MAG TPA: MFS transporter, partial [Pirellulales bacterium]